MYVKSTEGDGMNERFSILLLLLGISVKLTIAGLGGVVSYTGGTLGTLIVTMLEMVDVMLKLWTE